MKKRILSMLLALALTGLFPAAARAEEASVASITVQLTLYEKGQFAKDKDGRIMFQRSVTVTDDNGDGTYSLNEALLAAHTAYCSAGADGYTVSGSWVTQLWGTATSDYGFYKNNAVTGTVDAEALADGDQITAFTYYDTAGYSDRYSFFTEAEKTVTAGEEFTLTLMSWGYDGNFNPVQARWRPPPSALTIWTPAPIPCRPHSGANTSMAIFTAKRYPPPPAAVLHFRLQSLALIM